MRRVEISRPAGRVDRGAAPIEALAGTECEEARIHDGAEGRRSPSGLGESHAPLVDSMASILYVRLAELCAPGSRAEAAEVSSTMEREGSGCTRESHRGAAR